MKTFQVTWVSTFCEIFSAICESASATRPFVYTMGNCRVNLTTVYSLICIICENFLSSDFSARGKKRISETSGWIVDAIVALETTGMAGSLRVVMQRRVRDEGWENSGWENSAARQTYRRQFRVKTRWLKDTCLTYPTSFASLPSTKTYRGGKLRTVRSVFPLRE